MSFVFIYCVTWCICNRRHHRRRNYPQHTSSSCFYFVLLTYLLSVAEVRHSWRHWREVLIWLIIINKIMSSGPPTKRIRQIAGHSRRSFEPTNIGNHFCYMRYCLDYNITIRRKTAQNPLSAPARYRLTVIFSYYMTYIKHCRSRSTPRSW